MKQIKKYLTMKWCALISALLGMLGFAACGSKGEVSYGPDLYGQPYATFKIDGAVLNEEGKGVEGVKVYVRGNYGDTTKTNKDGKFVFNADDIIPYNNYWVIAEDPSGVYAKDSVNVAADFKGGDGNWYSGSCSTTQNITLKKKPSESETPETPSEPEPPSNPEE